MGVREVIRRFVGGGEPDEPVSIQGLRARLVNIIILIALVGFPLSMPVTFPVLLREGLQALVLIDLILFASLFYFIFVSRKRTRSSYYLVVALAYLLSLSFTVSLGPTYARGGWLVTVVVVAAFLLGSRAASIMAAVNVFTLVGLYFVMSIIDPSWLERYEVTGSVWAMFVVNITGLAVACGLPVGYLLSDLDRALQEERAVRQRLQKTLDALEEEVAARKKLEADLLRTQKLEAVGRFASGIAHDLNNLFVPVMTHAQLAEKSLGQPEKAKMHLEQIVQSSHQAKEMVTQILAFGRQSDTPKKLLDLRELLKDFLSRLDLPEEIRLETVVAPGEALVHANQTELMQVLTNLTVNAISAMEPEGGSLRLSLTFDAEGPTGTSERPPLGWYRLEVADTGCGMDEQTAARAFDPFFTTRKLGKGTGLGLAIVHGIVTAHGGRIDLQTEQGKGTTVFIYLPVASQGETEPVSGANA
jgi:signal transduction histidine kinase